jgi:hypothetical protein
MELPKLPNWNLEIESYPFCHIFGRYFLLARISRCGSPKLRPTLKSTRYDEVTTPNGGGRSIALVASWVASSSSSGGLTQALQASSLYIYKTELVRRLLSQRIWTSAGDLLV